VSWASTGQQTPLGRRRVLPVGAEQGGHRQPGGSELSITRSVQTQAASCPATGATDQDWQCLVRGRCQEDPSGLLRMQL
jgi:hypothetical protein